jgi:hypothetical protein
MSIRFLALAAILAAAAPTRAQQTFVIPLAEDTLLYVDNRGVTRIIADLNGYPFKLVTDAAEADRSQGAYLIPLHGPLTIDIAAYMVPGFDTNVITFTTQGPVGTDWQFILAPVFVLGQTDVAHTLSGLVPYPEGLSLLPPYPNPTRAAAVAAFTIPAARTTGVPVRLAVLDVLGREVGVLTEGVYYPGRYEFEWDGRAAGAGVYLVVLDAEGTRQTRRLTHLH